MKILTPTFAALALSLAVAAPASAQMANGIGVADPAVVVASSKALQGAYGLIATTYSAQRTQLEQLDKQRTDLLKTFDTNKDGKIDGAEGVAYQDTNNPTRKQIDALEKTISQVQGPINMARAYVVEQIAEQLGPSVQQVVSGGKVQMIIAPDSVLYMAPAADVTDQITTALNTRLPQVSITVPNGWQPSQQTAQLFQQVQQVLLAAAVQQQQQQASGAQAPAAAPAAGSTAPVSGR